MEAAKNAINKVLGSDTTDNNNTVNPTHHDGAAGTSTSTRDLDPTADTTRGTHTGYGASGTTGSATGHDTTTTGTSGSHTGLTGSSTGYTGSSTGNTGSATGFTGSSGATSGTTGTSGYSGDTTSGTTGLTSGHHAGHHHTGTGDNFNQGSATSGSAFAHDATTLGSGGSSGTHSQGEYSSGTTQQGSGYGTGATQQSGGYGTGATQESGGYGTGATQQSGGYGTGATQHDVGHGSHTTQQGEGYGTGATHQQGIRDNQTTQQGVHDTQSTQQHGEHDSHSKHHDSGHKGHHIPNPLHRNKGDDTESGTTGSSDHLQNSSQGRDPAVVGDDSTSKKLTGTGVPGSHSAVFGLTPDGKTHNETTNESGPVVPASELGKPHKKDDKDKVNEKNDTSSRAPDSAGVAEQMHKHDTEPKGLQRKEPMDIDSTDSTKPGAGSTGISQGTGDIRPGEGGDKTVGDRTTPA